MDEKGQINQLLAALRRTAPTASCQACAAWPTGESAVTRLSYALLHELHGALALLDCS